VFANWSARTVRLTVARRTSSENSCKRFKEKFVLRGDVIRHLLQKTSDRRSNGDKADLRFNLAAMGSLIQSAQSFFNFRVRLGVLPQNQIGGMRKVEFVGFYMRTRERKQTCQDLLERL